MRARSVASSDARRPISRTAPSSARAAVPISSAPKSSAAARNHLPRTVRDFGDVIDPSGEEERGDPGEHKGGQQAHGGGDSGASPQ